MCIEGVINKKTFLVFKLNVPLNVGLGYSGVITFWTWVPHSFMFNLIKNSLMKYLRWRN
jgi:hypothetical protein